MVLTLTRPARPSGTPGAPRSARTAGLLAVLMLFLASTGCTLTRQQQLQSRSESVNGKLLSERTRVLALPASDAERPARIDHLTNLKLTLSAANVALGTVPHVVPLEQRPIAYDILQEVYGTIDWNIPLGPAETKKPLPAGWAGNALQLAPLTQPRPLTPGINP